MKLDEAKARVQAIRADLQAQVDTIAGNANFSREGQIHEIAKAIVEHRQKAVDLRDEFVTTSDTARRGLAKKLFGLPADADPTTTLVFRDAQDRAAKITDPDELGRLFTQASNLGDDMMARALASRAYSQGQPDLAATYAADTGQADVLAELNELPSGGNFSAAVGIVFSVGTPTMPPELTDALRATAPGALTGDDVGRRLEKLAETPPTQPSAPTRGKAYRPGSVGVAF
ncbi:hypothetical protein [Mycolicibacter senuensis]|uniref:Uncharacterized protein n=1 Tax=Mycolicibacter senuensis TaxID=386913 RepID=A0A7I9XPD7_9MYCO|nr:hypothetical protein [Mycolicibacter senuensis]ORW69688.1 hypothetical protein AWC24_04670 [Mycolicibacter senuensis]GFG71842.1 hypothetical protein MSEN_35620 [Mycolicibacter senuensis]